MATVKIKGMSCQHCVKSVTDTLKGLEGVNNVEVDLEKGEANFDGEVEMAETDGLYKQWYFAGDI